ncbi:hypothetical protein RIF29_38268 [Crotalaria pallida]|uniref:Uncharacterized protein n=1 Tax=Crotalaria pallida TaxID=3830 RepID=A0AAN9DZU6_CROPI
MASFKLTGTAAGGAHTKQLTTLCFPSTPQIPFIASLNFTPPLSLSSFRCTGSGKLQINQRPLIVHAANPNSKGGKSLNEGSDVKEASNAARGPPLLTILAGFFVFFLVCWTIGSIITWLISLIVNAPPPK